MIKIHIAFYFALQLIFTNLAAQNSKISKEEVVEKLLSNNSTLKSAAQDVLSAKSVLQQSNAVILPQVELSYTAITTTNPLMAFGSRLNQERLVANDFNPALLNDPDRINNYATVVEVQQPIFNMDGIHQRQAAKLGYEISTLQENRKKDFMILEAEKAYMDLQLSHEALKVSKQALETMRAQFNVAVQLEVEGIIQKVDLLEVSIALSETENRLSNAKSNLQNASDYLAYLIQATPEGVYTPKDSLKKNITLVDTSAIILPERRADIIALELAERANNSNLKSSKAAFIPKINAFGSYQLYDDKAFQADASGYLVGARLSWNLFQGNQRTGKINQSKAEHEKSKIHLENYKAQSQMEIRRTLRRVQDASERIETSRLMLKQAKESLRIRSNRFKEGMEKPADLSAAQSAFSNKQLIYYQSIYEYNLALAQLNFLTKEN
tara:strand:+ start:324 stop:1640 length:1317 start_codon:yes stop_codon:yes gene_type:complete